MLQKWFNDDDALERALNGEYDEPPFLLLIEYHIQIAIPVTY